MAFLLCCRFSIFTSPKFKSLPLPLLQNCFLQLQGWKYPVLGKCPRVVSMRVKILEVQPSAEVIAEVPYWLTYDFPPEVSEKLKHQWESDWKGQAQKWPLVESGKNPQKYGVEDLEQMLGEFFEGKNLNEPKR